MVASPIPTTTGAVSLIARGKSWHTTAHVQVRKEMMLRLRNHPALSITQQQTLPMPTLLQRLEWMLYHAAHSMDEYTNYQTLERRIQSLVTHFRRSAAVPTAAQLVERTSFRANSMDLDANDSMHRLKRQRTQSALSGCSFLLNDDMNLLGRVFSFLDGFEVLRARGVNEFMRQHAPLLVTQLNFDASRPFMACSLPSEGFLTDLLLNCKNLERLTISNRTNQENLKGGVVFPRALSSTQQRQDQQSLPHLSGGLSKTSRGSQILVEITRAFQLGACLNLKSLELLAPFDFASEGDIALAVLQAFACGRSTSTLRDLVLDSTFLGDKGIVQLANLFETNLSFRGLETLVLRNNFIGEAGAQALFERLDAFFPELSLLDVSRNILTDTDAILLANMLKSDETGAANSNDEYSKILKKRPLNQLRALVLTENFIGCTGFHAILSTLSPHKVAIVWSCERIYQAVSGVFGDEDGDEEMESEGENEEMMDIEDEDNAGEEDDSETLFRQ